LTGADFCVVYDRQATRDLSLESGSQSGVQFGRPPPEGQLDDSLSSSAPDSLQVVFQLPQLGVALGSVNQIVHTHQGNSLHR
jgi:hypothetical protein